MHRDKKKKKKISMTNRLMAQNNKIIKLNSKCVKDDHPPTQFSGWQRNYLFNYLLNSLNWKKKTSLQITTTKKNNNFSSKKKNTNTWHS